MNGQYYRLIIVTTIRLPMAENDIQLRCSRTLPFPPVEGMTLVVPNDDDEEHEVVLGPPRYEFAESAFVEYQEDESLMEALREGYYNATLRDSLIGYYGTFGFSQVRRTQAVGEPA